MCLTEAAIWLTPHLRHILCSSSILSFPKRDKRMLMLPNGKLHCVLTKMPPDCQRTEMGLAHSVISPHSPTVGSLPYRAHPSGVLKQLWATLLQQVSIMSSLVSVFSHRAYTCTIGCEIKNGYCAPIYDLNKYNNAGLQSALLA